MSSSLHNPDRSVLRLSNTLCKLVMHQVVACCKCMNEIGIKHKIRTMGRASRQPLHLHLPHAASPCKHLRFEDWLSMQSAIADAQFPQSRVGLTAPVLLAAHTSASTCLSQQPGTAAIARPLPDGQPTIIASRSRKEIHNTQSRTSIAPKVGSTIHRPVFHQRAAIAE